MVNIIFTVSRWVFYLCVFYGIILSVASLVALFGILLVKKDYNFDANKGTLVYEEERIIDFPGQVELENARMRFDTLAGGWLLALAITGCVGFLALVIAWIVNTVNYVRWERSSEEKISTPLYYSRNDQV